MKMAMDDTLLKKRFIELADRTFRTGIPSFTPFLGLAEQDCFFRVKKNLPPVPYTLYGGTEGCERLMVRFGDDEFCGFDCPFPIVCLSARPLSQKFSDALTHRDILGAIMNLGIDRSTVGDIVLVDNIAYIFCTELVQQHIADNLTRAKHTELSVSLAEAFPTGELYKLERVKINIASERLDCVTAKFLNLSRGETVSLIEHERVFINGRVCTNAGKSLDPGDKVTVRGYGRFIFVEQTGVTKKGRLSAVIDKYI